MSVKFTAHNIRLDDGSLTRPGAGPLIDEHPWLVSARRVLDTVFPGDRSGIRIADLGCLEGGYAVAFARMGFEVLGVEVRPDNFAACEYVSSKTDLPNLTFVQDDAWNLADYGEFDAVFCCGLLYHLDRPRAFLDQVASATRKLLMVQTHFSTAADGWRLCLPAGLQKLVRRLAGRPDHWFVLSRLTGHEGLIGRWYEEFPDEASFRTRTSSRWASWNNRRSFWIQREYLLEAIRAAGFDLVAEQFDSLEPEMAASLLRGFYRRYKRGTFIGIKTGEGL